MPRELLAKYRSQSGWVKAFIITVISICGLIGALWLTSFLFFKPIKNPIYGVSFSKLRADELGVDWKANYLALLDDLHFKHFRLMSYWSESETTRGQFNFDDLDWQMDQAAKRGAKVTLVIGLRQPRWPECYQPSWASQLRSNAWKQALYAYMEVVVKRYQHNPALDKWQLENEPVNDWFGTCDLPDRQRLYEEYMLLKKWDNSHHTIDITLSDEHGLPINPPVPDEYGHSVYRTIYNSHGPGFYFTYPTPVIYHRARAFLVNILQHRPSYIHELQTEPWGPIDTKYLSIQEQDKSMSVQQIHQNILFARKLGMRNIDLWGGEWWYWRKVHLNDSSIWDAVKEEVSDSQ